MNPELKLWLRKVSRFEDTAHKLLGRHEESGYSRVAILEKTYSQLDKLSLSQDDLMRQAIRCAESKLFRASHVMAWAACMDFIQEILSSDLPSLRQARPAWRGTDIAEISESVPERQLVEVLKDLGLATKNEVAALVGLLQRRNECAHPSAYYPQINETLGYLSEILQRIAHLKAKWTPTV